MSYEGRQKEALRNRRSIDRLASWTLIFVHSAGIRSELRIDLGVGDQEHEKGQFQLVQMRAVGCAHPSRGDNEFCPKGSGAAEGFARSRKSVARTHTY
jgi:hypothetical protein